MLENLINENITTLASTFGVSVIGLITIWYKSKKKKDSVFEDLILNMINTQNKQAKILEKLSESQAETLLLISSISSAINKKFNTIIVTNDNSANIIKDAIFAKQGIEFVDLITDIYEQNGIIEQKQFVLDKIKSSIKNLLHSTDEKLKIIPGMRSYLIDFNDFLVDVEATNIYNIVYQLMYDVKTDINEKRKGSKVDNLRKKVKCVYQIYTQQLQEKYKF